MSTYFMSTYFRYFPCNLIARPILYNGFNDFWNSLCRCQSNNQKYSFVHQIEPRASCFNENGFAKQQIRHKKLGDSESYTERYRQLCNGRKDEEISIDHIEKSLLDALRVDNLKEVQIILQKCMNQNMCLSAETLKKVLSEYARNANVKMITTLKEYHRNTYPDVLSMLWEFDDYLVMAYWQKGNIDGAFSIIKLTYSKRYDIKFKIHVRKLLEGLICETFDNSSEASIVKIKRNVLSIAAEFNDSNPLCDFWKCCWRSQWFHDQQLAEKLFDDHKKLRLMVADRIFYLSSSALKAYDEDAVMRLLQTLLKHDMLYAYTNAIKILLDYRLKRRDLDGCSEIIQNCSVLNIKLSSFHNQQYLNMMLSKGKYCADTEKPAKKEIKGKDIKLKF